MPVLPLPPRIAPEPVFGTVLSSHVTEYSQFGDSAPTRSKVFPQMSFYVAVGSPEDPRAFRFRFAAYAGLGSAGIDGFVAVPKGFSVWDVGAGVIVQPVIQRAVAPYVSVGREVGDEGYVWFTQGATQLTSGRDSTARWTSTSFLGVRRSKNRAALTVFAAAVIGSQGPPCGLYKCAPVTRAYLGFAGEGPFRRNRGPRILRADARPSSSTLR